MWNFNNINFACRLFTDENGKFKFDFVLKTGVLITDGKIYDNFESASSALKDYLDKMYDYEDSFNKMGFEKHLIVNEIK